MNTTELIKHWTMEGASPDVGDRFRSTAGLRGVAGGAPEPSDGTTEALRMRQSGEEDWRPLLLAADDK